MSAEIITTPTTIKVVWVVSVLFGQTTFLISVADCLMVSKAIEPNSVNLIMNSPNEKRAMTPITLYKRPTLL